MDRTECRYLHDSRPPILCCNYDSTRGGVQWSWTHLCCWPQCAEAQERRRRGYRGRMLTAAATLAPLPLPTVSAPMGSDPRVSTKRRRPCAWCTATPDSVPASKLRASPSSCSAASVWWMPCEAPAQAMEQETVKGGHWKHEVDVKMDVAEPRAPKCLGAPLRSGMCVSWIVRGGLYRCACDGCKDLVTKCTCAQYFCYLLRALKKRMCRTCVPGQGFASQPQTQLM